MEEYAKYIALLKPTWYVLPDSKHDASKSVELAKEFDDKYPRECYYSKSIGVIHGNNIDEMKKCYHDMYSIADKLAFSFEGWWFDWAKENNIPTELIRPMIISKIGIDFNKPHHILGCINPQEFKYYRKCNWIDSIDTSVPVAAALDGSVFHESTTRKPKSTIIGSFEEPLNKETIRHIEHNVKVFRNIIQ